MRKYLVFMFLLSMLFFFQSCQKEPTAAFIPSKTTVEVGEVVSFDNTSTNAVSFLWNFGDQTTSTLKSPSHSYDTPGTYLVSLTAYSKKEKKKHTVSELIQVNEAIPTTISDIDGNEYQIVTIGTQTWMAENLKTTRLSNGNAISNITSDSQWNSTTSPAYCWYNNSLTNKEQWGALYNWAAVNTGLLCPEGWHVPSDTEWAQLEMVLGLPSNEAYNTGWRGTDQGSQMASNNTLWTSGALASASQFGTSGFNALPAGRRNDDGAFVLMNEFAIWWSSTQNYSYNAFYRSIVWNDTKVGRQTFMKEHGFSIRCVKN